MEKKYRTTKELAEKDTAIEIMAARIGICITRLNTEEAKPEKDQDFNLINRLNKELEILSKERDRMYKGDQEIHQKIYNQYADEVKEFYLGKKQNDR